MFPRRPGTEIGVPSPLWRVDAVSQCFANPKVESPVPLTANMTTSVAQSLLPCMIPSAVPSCSPFPSLGTEQLENPPPPPSPKKPQPNQKIVALPYYQLKEEVSWKDTLPTHPDHTGHHAVSKMPVTMPLAPLGFHPCCSGWRDRSQGPACLPGLSCSKCCITVLWENTTELPVPPGRAILIPLTPFSETSCVLCGDLVCLGAAQVHGCRIRPSGLGLVLLIPPAPVASRGWVGELAASVGDNGGGIRHGVMSTGPMCWPRSAVEKVSAGCAVQWLNTSCKGCSWITPQPSAHFWVGSVDQEGLPSARLLRRAAWTNKSLPNNMFMSRVW